MKNYSVNIATIGSCRGDSFSNSERFNLGKFLEEVESSTEDSIYEIVEEKSEFQYLLYNHGITKENVLKVLKSLKRRKFISCCWEEGTTVASVKLSKRELQREAKLLEADWIQGIDPGDNIDQILK